MTARTLQAVVLLLGLALEGTAAACSCVRLEDDSTFFDDLYTRADAIVHAKVISLASSGEARIKLIESFKGDPTSLKAQSGDEGMCGTKFELGEEAVFVVYLNHINACGRIPVSRKLIEGLRAHKR